MNKLSSLPVVTPECTFDPHVVEQMERVIEKLGFEALALTLLHERGHQQIAPNGDLLLPGRQMVL